MNVVLIASRPRSGTHWLKSLLGSCPSVVAHEEEPFHNEWTGFDNFWSVKDDPAEYLMSRQQPDTRAIVYCCHPTQYDWEPRILPAIRQVTTHVVILYRRDLLAGFVSKELAMQNWEWPTTIGVKPAHGTITADLGKLGAWCEFIRASLATDRERWADRPCSVVAYEDLVGHLPGVLADLGRTLEIDVSGATAATERKERRPLWEVVTNYQEARALAARLAIT